VLNTKNKVVIAVLSYGRDEARNEQNPFAQFRLSVHYPLIGTNQALAVVVAVAVVSVAVVGILGWLDCHWRRFRHECLKEKRRRATYWRWCKLCYLSWKSNIVIGCCHSRFDASPAPTQSNAAVTWRDVPYICIPTRTLRLRQAYWPHNPLACAALLKEHPYMTMFEDDQTIWHWIELIVASLSYHPWSLTNTVDYEQVMHSCTAGWLGLHWNWPDHATTITSHPTCDYLYECDGHAHPTTTHPDSCIFYTVVALQRTKQNLQIQSTLLLTIW
jgi:hypothetical protein